MKLITGALICISLGLMACGSTSSNEPTGQTAAAASCPPAYCQQESINVFIVDSEWIGQDPDYKRVCPREALTLYQEVNESVPAPPGQTYVNCLPGRPNS